MESHTSQVMEWIDGEKGPWSGTTGIEMVSLGLKCSVDQLLNTGASPPHCYPSGNECVSPSSYLNALNLLRTRSFPR